MEEPKLSPQSPGIWPYSPLTCLPDNFHTLSVLAASDRIRPDEIENTKLNYARALERLYLNRKFLKTVPPDEWEKQWKDWQLELIKTIKGYRKFFLLIREIGLIDCFLESEMNSGFGLIPEGKSNSDEHIDIT